jgi:hypothetical protein
MGGDIQLLFREVADLSPREREQYFDRREVPPHLRAEVESLLRFDTPPTESLAGCVATTIDRNSVDVLHDKTAPMPPRPSRWTSS